MSATLWPMLDLPHTIAEDAARGPNPELVEASVLLWYVLSAFPGHYQPSARDVEIYLEALRANNISETPTLSPFVLRHARLLRLIDAASRIRFPESTLQKKLLVAAAVVESTMGSAEFLMAKDMSKTRWILHVLGAGFMGVLTSVIALPFMMFPSLLSRHVRH